MMNIVSYLAWESLVIDILGLMTDWHEIYYDLGIFAGRIGPGTWYPVPSNFPWKTTSGIIFFLFINTMIKMLFDFP